MEKHCKLMFLTKQGFPISDALVLHQSSEKHALAPCIAMATLAFSRQVSFSLTVCLLLVSLLLTSVHVQLGLVLEDEKLGKIVRVRSAKVAEGVTNHLSAQGFSKTSIERLQKCALLCGMSVETRLQSRVLWLLNSNQRKALCGRGNNNKFPRSWG